MGASSACCIQDCGAVTSQAHALSTWRMDTLCCRPPHAQRHIHSHAQQPACSLHGTPCSHASVRLQPLRPGLYRGGGGERVVATRLPYLLLFNPTTPSTIKPHTPSCCATCVCRLFHGGALKVSIMEGTIPNLHITTDLLAMLIPELPRKYPKQYMRIDVTALAAPLVTFSAAPAGTGTTTLVASYRTAIYVANDTLGNPHIATLNANITVGGQVRVVVGEGCWGRLLWKGARLLYWV